MGNENQNERNRRFNLISVTDLMWQANCRKWRPRPIFHHTRKNRSRKRFLLLTSGQKSRCFIDRALNFSTNSSLGTHITLWNRPEKLPLYVLWMRTITRVEDNDEKTTIFLHEIVVFVVLSLFVVLSSFSYIKITTKKTVITYIKITMK